MRNAARIVAPPARRGSARKKLWLLALALSISALASCRSKGNVVGDAAPPPSLSAKSAKESVRSKDELWRRASSQDPVDLARLADREGAGGLLEGLEEGGPLGLVALDALAFADDADAAYQRLGEIVRQIDPGESSPVVGAILAISLRPRRQTEPVDPPGLRSCAAALLEFAQKKSASTAVRAQAISALRLLSERKAIDPKLIPTDLDAR